MNTSLDIIQIEQFTPTFNNETPIESEVTDFSTSNLNKPQNLQLKINDEAMPANNHKFQIPP
jgi:hypothetical protein